MMDEVDFTDKTINVWSVVYDCSGDNMYVFSDYEAVKSSVIGSIWSYCTLDDEDETIEQIISYVKDILDKSEDISCLPISVDSLSIIIYKFTIDSSHMIHKVLSKCYPKVEADLQEDIKKIFNGEPSNQT